MVDPVASALAGLEDIKRFEGIPARSRYPCASSYALIQQSCSKFSDSPALTFVPHGHINDSAVEISYSTLFQRITQTANLLTSLGIGSTDTVSILLPNLIETHYALWGASAAGIAGPINPFLSAEYITQIMNVTRTRALITLACDEDSAAWRKICAVVQNTPTLETIILVTPDGVTQNVSPGRPVAGIRTLSFSKELDQQDGTRLTPGRVFHARDISMHMHTGGTTGCPKVAKLSHGGQALMAQLYADMTARLGQFTSLCGLPLFHVFGITATGLAAFTAGRHMVLMTPRGFRNPEVIKNFWHHVARFKCRTFAAVPTVLSALLDVPIGNNDISCLTETATGAAPLPDQLKINFENRFGVHIHNGYGMTESSLMLTRSAFDFPPPLGSVGLPIPYASVITAEVKDNRLIRECGTNETGVILARGPSVFHGYLNPADDADAWVDKHWFNTGDLGYKDEQGYLFLTGRSRDLIIRGGHNIDPAIIEEPLTQHPAIAQVVAIGQPDPYAGEIPIAYVTLISGQSVDPDELLLYCQKMIGEPAAVPKRIEIITEFPLTAVAKIYKPALRQRAAEFALTTSLSAAGIEASVTAWIDLQRGLLARIELDCAEQQSQAEAVLQNYPLIIEFE